MVQQRGRERELYILQTVHELLHEVGYERLTVDAVVAKARASKTTIYTRWPDKASLVSAALNARSQDQPHLQSSTGTLRDDLVELVRLWVRLAETESLSTFVSVLIAARDEPALSATVRGTALQPRRDECAAVIRWARERGDAIGEDVSDKVFDLLMGMVLVRYVLELRPLGSEEQVVFADDVLAVLRRTA